MYRVITYRVITYRVITPPSDTSVHVCVSEGGLLQCIIKNFFQIDKLPNRNYVEFTVCRAQNEYELVHNTEV
jgi:hypothetical protein